MLFNFLDVLTIHPNSFDKHHFKNESSSTAEQLKQQHESSNNNQLLSSSSNESHYSKRRRLVQLLSHLKPIKNQQLRTKILNKLKESKIELLDHHLFKQINAPLLHNLFSHNINSSNERIRVKYYNEYDSQILLHPFQSVNKLVNFIKSVYNVLEMVDQDDHYYHDNKKLKEKEGKKKENNVGFDLPDDEDEDQQQQQHVGGDQSSTIHHRQQSTATTTVNTLDRMLYNLFNFSGGGNSDNSTTATGAGIIGGGISGGSSEMNQEKNKSLDPFYANSIDRPISSSIIILFIEIILNIIKSLSILTLLTVTYVHERFNYFIKPILVIEFSKLEQNLSNLILNFKKYFRIGTNAKLTIARLLAKIRNNNPKNFYMILSVYLKMKNLMQIPKSFVNQIFWTITNLYLNILLFCIFIFEKIASPKLLHLIYMSNDKFLEILSQVLQFMNHYYKNAIERDELITLKRHENDLDSVNKYYSPQPIQGTEN